MEYDAGSPGFATTVMAGFLLLLSNSHYTFACSRGLVLGVLSAPSRLLG